MLLFLLLCCNPLAAQTDKAEDILIRNVTMMDPAGVAPDRLVNILITNKELEVITEDKISRDEANQVIDANGGFIIGKLRLVNPRTL